MDGDGRVGAGPAAPAVVARGLTRRFGPVTAVDRLDLAVPRGELFGLVGPDGAGKSTTLRMLAGILTPSDGDALVVSCSVRAEPEAVKPRIAYMSQRFSLYEDLTVEQNLDFYGGIYRIPKASREARKAWAIEMAGLEASGSFRIVERPPDAGGRSRLLDEGRVKAALRFDPGFTTDLARGRTAALQIPVDGTDSSTASVVMDHASRIITRYNREAAARTSLNPLRYFLVVIRGIFLKGNGPSVLWPEMLALFVLGAAVFAVSTLRIRKRLE